MRLLVGIITYEPDLTRLEQVLSAVSPEYMVLIVDNGSTNQSEISGLIGDRRQARIEKNLKNEGIAKALNQIFHFAEAEHCDWVLSLDQDTVIPPEMPKEFECLWKNDNSDKKIAIFCPRIHDRISQKTWPVFEERETSRLVNRCITSGSFTSVMSWKTIGGFDEYLFIDEVDHDFCYRLIQNGYQILQYRDWIIDHQIGNTEIRKFFGKTINVRNHSAFRKYYIVRNMLYLSKKNHHRIMPRDYLHAVLFTLKTCLFEKQKAEKLKACVRGFRDGRRKAH